MTWRKMNPRDWGSFISTTEPDDGDISPAIANSTSKSEFSAIDGSNLGTDSNYGSVSSTDNAGLGYLSLRDVVGATTNTPTLSDGYKATDVDLSGGAYPHTLSDNLDISKFSLRNNFGLTAANELAHLKLAIEHPHYDAWQGSFEVGTHGGMAHRWSDMGEAYGTGLTNIRASTVRSTRFFDDDNSVGNYPVNFRTGNNNNPSYEYYKNAGWFRKYPKYLLVDGAQGQPSSSVTTWRTKVLPTTSYKDLDGLNVRLIFVYRNGIFSTSYRGDLQITDIRVGQYFENAAAGQKVYNFATSTEGFQTSGYTQSYNTNPIVSADRAADGFDTNRLDGLTWNNLTTSTTSNIFNRDFGGTGSSSTGISSSVTGTNYYIYAETSGSSTNGRFYCARSPVFQFHDDLYSVPSYATGRYGSNIGDLRTYFEIMPPVMLQHPTWSGDIVTTSSSSSQNRGVQIPDDVRGRKCRMIWFYVSGDTWSSDLQLSNFYYNTTGFSTTSGGTYVNLATQSQYGYWRYAMGSAPNFSTSNILNLYNDQPGFFNLVAGTSQGQWNRRSQGSGTPSGGTGISTVGSSSIDSEYVYYEASGAGYPYAAKILRTPEFVAGTGSNVYVNWAQGNLGAGMGKLRIYFIYGDTARYAGSVNV